MDTFFEGNSVIIVIDTGFEGLDSATLIEIVVTKPSGNVAKWAAEQVDPTDAIWTELGLTVTDQDITYTTDSDDLDETGTYKMQAHVEWNAGMDELHGTIEKFKVKAHLPEARMTLTGSYVDAAEAETYFENNPRAITFLDSEYLEWYLQEATRHIDQLRLRGDKYDSTQDRAFPRVIDGIIVGDSDQNVVVPDDVLRACMEEAIALYAYYASTSEQKRASLQAQGVKSYSIGDLSETYGPSTTTGPMQGLKSSAAYRLLSRYIAHSVTVR
jgi:hypothetical protein